MDNIELYLLILVAVLEVVDGQGIALRILRVLMSLVGGNSNVKESENHEPKKN